MSHNHSHGGGCGGGSDHSLKHPDAELGKMYSLYLRVDTVGVQCLNEAVEGSGRQVFKAWEERKDKSKFVDSDVDQELLFNIPFTGSVKLKGLIVIGGDEEKHPSKMRLFKNKPGMTFDDTQLTADQEFELHPDPEGVLEYNTKVARFNHVTHLSLHFPTNFGDDSTRIYYIGLRGDFTEVNRQEVVICTYEMKPNPVDHKSNKLDSDNFLVS